MPKLLVGLMKLPSAFVTSTESHANPKEDTMILNKETAYDKATKTHEAARKAAKRAEAAVYAADAALIAKIAAGAAYNAANEFKYRMAADADEAAKASKAATDKYTKDVEARQKARLEAQRKARAVAERRHML